jgi:hypothetical protein
MEIDLLGLLGANVSALDLTMSAKEKASLICILT